MVSIFLQKKRELAAQEEIKNNSTQNLLKMKFDQCSNQLNELVAKSCKFQQEQNHFENVTGELLLSKIKLGKAEAVAFCRQNCLQLANLDGHHHQELLSHQPNGKGRGKRSAIYWSESAIELRNEIETLTCSAIKFGKKKLSSVQVACSRPLRFVCAAPIDYTFESHFLFDEITLEMEQDERERQLIVEKTPGQELLRRMPS